MLLRTAESAGRQHRRLGRRRHWRASAGITPTASVSAGQSKSSSLDDGKFSPPSARSNNITFVSKGDTTLNNTVFSADTINGDVGGNLSIVSTPNTGTQSNSSSSLGFSFTGGTIGKDGMGSTC